MALTCSKLLMSVPRPHWITSSVFEGSASFTFPSPKLKLKCSGGSDTSYLQHDMLRPKRKPVEAWYYNGVDQEFVDQLTRYNCIGSSHGWLGYVNPDDLSFYLFKPNLRDDERFLPFIMLPPIQFAAENPNVISKMVLTSSPEPIKRCDPLHNPNNTAIWVVTTLDSPGPAAAFCRIGFDKWATLTNFPEDDDACSHTFQDITYCDKRELFYVVTDSGKIYSFDISSYSSYPLKLQRSFHFRYLAKAPLNKFNPGILKSQQEIVNSKYYLAVDESSGSLMVIHLHISCNLKGYKNTYHNTNERWEKVYMHHIDRLDLDRLEWFKVKDLVNTCLFIGRNNGVVVDVSKAPGLMMPGYIYLACNAAGFFQLAALPVKNVEGASQDYNFLRGYSIREEMNSFPVWNFE